MKAETTLKILSKIKQEIVSEQKEREQLMIEFLKIKALLATKDQYIGKLQRKMLENIP